jgi:hypothetical protein
MKYFITALFSVFMTQNIMAQNTPEEITKEFIKDYKVWNDKTYELHNAKNPEAGQIAEKEYKLLIEKYCLPNKIYQYLAFGSNAIHSPEEESVKKTKIGQNKAIVKTIFKDKNLDFIVNNYEYHFVLLDGKWLLEEVYFVDEDGKYPGL